MKSKKTLKKALISSILALVLCFTMLIGTTYAWFTDSVTSSGNIIKSGTLNIDLGIKAEGDTDYVSVKENPTKKAFNYDKWEPGYTAWVNAKVTTTGNLALKYTMKIVAEGEVSALADVIDVYYAPAEVAKPATRDLSGLTKIGTLADALAGTIVINDTLIPETNEADFATLALHMQESAGNEYQNLSIGTSFSLQILATQYTYEADSFGIDYDENALFPNQAIAGTAADLVAAVAGEGITEIELNADVTLESQLTVEGKSIDGKGKTITTTGASVDPDCVLNIKEGSLSNVTVLPNGWSRGIGTGSSGQYAMTGDVYLDKVDVTGGPYAINIGNGNGKKLVVTDSALRGWTSMANIDASFTNTTFATNGQYQYFAFWNGTYTFTNCTFVDGFQFFSRAGQSGTITLTNCTWDGTPVTAANFAECFDAVHDSDFDYIKANFTVVVDGTTVVF